MALDIYFTEDVARILAALSSAGDQHGPDYQKALGDVGLAFGLSLTDVARARLPTQQRVWPIQVVVPEDGVAL